MTIRICGDVGMEYKLEELFDLQMGKTPSRNNSDYWNTKDNKWISIADLSKCGKYIGETKEYISDDAVENSGISKIPANTVVMSFKLSIGKTAITAEDMYSNEAIMSFHDKHIVNLTPEYVYYLLLAHDWTDGTNKAVMGKTLNKATLSKVKVNIHSSEEQAEIVACLNSVASVISARQRQLEKLDDLVKARFIELFGNFVYERGRWSTCEIGDVADTIDPQPSHRTPPVSSDGVPYIGIAECNYKTLQIDFANARKVGRDVLQEHLNRYTLNKGDFIIGKIGTIGKPFFLPDKQTYTLSANTVLIKPNKQKVEPQFLFAVFQSEYMERIIDAEKKSTSQPAFGIQKVRKIDIPMPPMELQKRFAAFVEQTDKSKVAIQKALDEAQLLFGSLMQKYFG